MFQAEASEPVTSRYSDVNMRYVAPPLEVCNKVPSVHSESKRRQRRTNSSSVSVSSALTEVFDENESDYEDKTVELKNVSFEDFHPTARLTENPQSKRRGK